MALPETIEAFLADPSDDRHGTVNGYQNLKCRCDLCRDAWRVKRIAYRATPSGAAAALKATHKYRARLGVPK